MKSLASLFHFVALTALTSADRTVTVTNKCSYTVWPGLSTDPSVNTVTPSQATGWEMASGASVSFSVPDNWAAGRIWPRTECSFSSLGSGTCVTGNCDSSLECAPDEAPSGPVTLAEFTLGSPGQSDFYDVSVVDGFNVPVEISNTAGCATSSCSVDLNANCPAKLQNKDTSGKVVGCLSDCEVDPNPANSSSCCTGSFSTPATCPPSGVLDYAFFKNNCPTSIVFPYDETSSPLPCLGSQKADYIVTFCP